MIKSLSAHITHYDSVEKKDILHRCIDGLLSIDIDVNVTIHTNTEITVPFKHVQIVVHDMKNEHPHYLTWKHREFMKDEDGLYDAYMYIENDIEFSQANFDYWIANQERCADENLYLSFVRFETDGEKRLCTDIATVFGNYPLVLSREIEGKCFLINNCNPYCGFWIVSAREFKKFSSNILYDLSVCPWHGNYVREKAACGPSPLYDAVLIDPSDKGCFVHHMSNNYIGHEVLCKIEVEDLKVCQQKGEHK